MRRNNIFSLLFSLVKKKRKRKKAEEKKMTEIKERIYLLEMRYQKNLYIINSDYLKQLHR